MTKREEDILNHEHALNCAFDHFEEALKRVSIFAPTISADARALVASNLAIAAATEYSATQTQDIAYKIADYLHHKFPQPYLGK